MDNNWGKVLKEEMQKPYFKELEEFVEEEYAKHIIFPPRDMIYNALEQTDIDKVKVVILGQDPYHGEHQAMGMSFSVFDDQKVIPPSLKNIYKEIAEDIGCEIPSHGNLEKWAEQGVLLLNTVLTVRAHMPNSHKDKGWEIFTHSIIEKLNMCDRPIVYLLWGKPAQNKKKIITNPRHLILEAPHPSPLSSYRGFFGCKHFSKANNFLELNGCTPINWENN